VQFSSIIPENRKIIHIPVHPSIESPSQILLRWLAHGIFLIARQYDYVILLIPKRAGEETKHILDIIDGISKLIALRKIINSN
jgi:hypothetical protein